MNFRNLIYLADDVPYMKTSLVNFSTFPFENCLGHLKKLVRTPVNPLVHVSMRFREIEGGDCLMKPRPLFSVNKKLNKFSYSCEKNSKTVKEIEFKNFVVTSASPNNVVLLNNGKVCVIKLIFFEDGNAFATVENIHFSGSAYAKGASAFQYPQESTIIGLQKISDLSKT